MTAPTEETAKPKTGNAPKSNKAVTNTSTPEKRPLTKMPAAKPDTHKQETPYESQIFTIPEVAGRLQMSTYTVQDMLRKGELGGSKLRSRWRITGSQIDAYLERSKVKPK